MERDRKKEKKKPKTTESGGSKKGAAAGMAGVPAAMPVSLTTTEVFFGCVSIYKPRGTWVSCNRLF